jgi:membrane protease YdiL (CAAX protease family)
MNIAVNENRSAWVARHALPLYFVLAYAFSWAIEVPVALSVQGVISADVPPELYYFASFGPFVSALVVTIAAEGFPGLQRLFSGLAKWRVGKGYAFFAILTPPILFAFAVLVSRLLQGSWPDLSLLSDIDYLPRLGILGVLGLWLLTFGLGEETGWRGFALPRLQASRSAFSAALIIGVLHTFWHLPAFFFRDTYTSMGLLLGLPMLLISVVSASFIMTWLYNGTRGSLLMIVLFHGLFNFFSVSEAGGESAAIVMSAVIVFWAVRVVNVYGRENLAPVEKWVV